MKKYKWKWLEVVKQYWYSNELNTACEITIMANSYRLKVWQKKGVIVLDFKKLSTAKKVGELIHKG